MSIQYTFSNGILVDINVNKWSAEKQLTAEDLGIPKDKIPDSFKLGKKPLLPPDRIAKFECLDGKARKLLIDMSYEYNIGPHCRFLPKKNILEFETKFQAIKDDYAKLVEDLITNWDMYKFAQRSEFIKAAKAAYVRLQAIGGFDVPEDKYINDFIERIENLYPIKEEIRSKYQMSHVFWQMELPDLAEASVDDVTEEGQKVKLLQEAYQKKMLKQIDEYAEKLVKDNREATKKDIDDVISLLNNSTKFKMSNYNKILNMISRFQRMDITADKTFETALLTFKSKYLDGKTAKQIENSKAIKTSMIEDLIQLNKLISNTEQIKALAEAYKQQIQKVR